LVQEALEDARYQTDEQSWRGDDCRG